LKQGSAKHSVQGSAKHWLGLMFILRVDDVVVHVEFPDGVCIAATGWNQAVCVSNVWWLAALAWWLAALALKAPWHACWR
jgi:hypothetical protein